MDAVFNFTLTVSPGPGFERMGSDSKCLVLFLGTLFFIGILILVAYVLHGFVYLCRKANKLFKNIDEWCRPKLYYSAMISYQLESSLDFALGTLLKFEEHHFTTASDIFDFALGLLAIIYLVVLPLI
jgi:hypothetical protein